jgi:hypothetical protein
MLAKNWLDLVGGSAGGDPRLQSNHKELTCCV